MNKDTLKEFKTYLWKQWVIDVIVRTIKTGCECLLAGISIGAMWQEIEWAHILSVTGVAMLYTVIFNIHKIAQSLDSANKMEAKDENMGSDDQRGTI